MERQKEAPAQQTMGLGRQRGWLMYRDASLFQKIVKVFFLDTVRVLHIIKHPYSGFVCINVPIYSKPDP